MNIDQDEVSQVVAIIEDCARIQSLIKSDREAAINEIKILSMLPHPSGLGSMPIGREASDRIFKLALRARHAHGLERRVSLQNVRKPLESELVKRFFKERRPVNHQQVNRLLSSAARAAERNCQDRTYYIPIRFASTQEPNCLSLGPVNLMTRKTAWSKLSTAGRAYARKYTDQSNRGISRMLIRDSLEYYRNFNWIAEVQIKGCDQETAEAAAFKAVGSAIDCLHIILSYRYSQKLRIGGLGLRSDRRALVQLDQNGEMEISSSHGWFEQAGLAEGWSKIFEERQYREMMRLTGIALQCRSDPTIKRPLCERYLDAATWFGEAVRDDVLSSRAVKYVAAIERILTAGKTKHIEKTISIRAADLLFDPNDPEGWEDNKNKILTAYKLRSDLLHGAISPHDEIVAQGINNCGDIAEDILRIILFRLGKDALLMEEASDKRYKNWLDRIREHVASMMPPVEPH